MNDNNNPYDLAHELARAMKDSETYQRYVHAQKELAKNPAAQEKVLHFRALQMEVNQAQILGQNLSEDKVGQVTLEYAKLNQDNSIAEFLNAQGMFMKMFTDIQEIIQKHLESGFVH
jgi:cell fate (sporulation/competence/biofilm development) regulator YlbF (YheA/YmcA/DUF963 family)